MLNWSGLLRGMVLGTRTFRTEGVYPVSLSHMKDLDHIISCFGGKSRMLSVQVRVQFSESVGTLYSVPDLGMPGGTEELLVIE